MARFRLPLQALCAALLLHATLAMAETYRSWGQLTPVQQEALQPLSAQWDALPTKLQKNLLHAAERYPRLTPEQKHRFQSRVEKWSKLTPEQRKRAREKYMAFGKVSPEKREAVKQMVREQRASQAASGGAAEVPASAVSGQ